ncbi:hypothetical protein SAY87_011503 [Trapa incisa]|uniref:non-specific serine/threonine protein kinase n=1 Tax=Trapa incisa TaxID=236973 RepID=A0AAN7JBI3_9MYRT|nr:hypothetical protein SAY87_011503 [Trapa incisa]
MEITKDIITTSSFSPLFLCLFSIFLILSSSSASTDEAAALFNWKASLLNQNRSDSTLSSWSNASASPCHWTGIACNSDLTVRGVNLTNMSVSGTLYEFPFGSLPNLTFIDIGINSFSGSIPSKISLLTKLTFLDLSNNMFSGPIPSEICKLTNLETLHLVFNRHNGSIPENIGNLYKLTELALYSNYLEGPIPPSIGNLSRLSSLYIYNNSLSGSIPPEMGNLTKLQIVFMNTNKFSGPLPATLGSLTELMELHIYGNLFTGSIPPELGRLKQLQRLVLNGNKLTGSIPRSFGNLTGLDLLYLYDNLLTGPIPDELGNLPLLSNLEVSSNNLTGPIPTSFNNLTSLESLFVRVNDLSGPIPTSIGSLPKLKIFEADNNRFDGFLPENLCAGGNISNLTLNNNLLVGQVGPALRNCTSSLVRLRLERNMFNENITESFGVFPNLNFVDLSNNGFYGEISSNWGRCPNLADLRIAGTNVSGRLPPEIGNSPSLQSLDLSSNHLTGEIPKEFGRLRAMTRLNMSWNQLSGDIPSELGNLSNLENLDLSRNLLASIPDSIGAMSRLNYLDLSYNKLNHEIPAEIGSLSHLSELHVNNNSLKGEIPQQFGKLVNLVTLNLSCNQLSGRIDKVLGYLVGLKSVDISYNRFEGSLPNITAFRDASPKNVQGNAGLCGNKTGLQPCPEPASTGKGSKSKTQVLVIVLSVVGGVLMLSTLLGLLIFLRTRRYPERAEEDGMDGEVLTIGTSEYKILYRDIVESTGGFDPMYCIGKGGYGSVYRAKLSSGLVVAVKKLHSISDSCSGPTYHQDFPNEIRALTNIRHRNIVKLYGFCSHPLHSFLVYEYLAKGSLASVLNNDKEAKLLDWDRRVNIVKGVAHALSYMHHDVVIPIVHRDISSGNILLDPDYEARVSDFGTAKLMKIDASSWAAVAGTYGYIAPELAYTMKANEKCDVYSFGVLMVEVIKGKHPGESITSLFPPDVDMKGVLDPRLPFPESALEDEIISIIQMARACLDENPNMRPSMKMISQFFSTSLPFKVPGH